MPALLSAVVDLPVPVADPSAEKRAQLLLCVPRQSTMGNEGRVMSTYAEEGLLVLARDGLWRSVRASWCVAAAQRTSKRVHAKPQGAERRERCTPPFAFVVAYVCLMFLDSDTLVFSFFARMAHDEAQLPWVKRSIVLRRGPVYVVQDLVLCVKLNIPWVSSLFSYCLCYPCPVVRDLRNCFLWRPHDEVAKILSILEDESET